MPKITREEVRVPADVMPEARDEYITNYLKATRETGRLCCSPAIRRSST